MSIFRKEEGPVESTPALMMIDKDVEQAFYACNQTRVDDIVIAATCTATYNDYIGDYLPYLTVVVLNYRTHAVRRYTHEGYLKDNNVPWYCREVI